MTALDEVVEKMADALDRISERSSIECEVLPMVTDLLCKAMPENAETVRKMLDHVWASGFDRAAKEFHKEPAEVAIMREMSKESEA